MIAAPSVEDQELTVGTKRSRVHNPAITRSRDLGRRAGGDREPFLGPAEAIGRPEITDLHTIDREGTRALGGRRGGGRGGAARILAGGEPRSYAPTALLCGSARRGFGRARLGRAVLLQLRDQVLEAIGVAGKLGRAVALGLQRL